MNITDDIVHVDQRRDRVARAPAYDPSLVDERYDNSLYRHYGYEPYWEPGYVYPPDPRYPRPEESYRR